MVSISRFLAWLGLMQFALRGAELVYKPAPPDNPLRGWAAPSSLPSRTNNLPHSLVYLDYPFGLLMPEADRFDWRSIDAYLKRFADSNRHAIIRIFVDWPYRGETFPKYLHEASTPRIHGQYGDSVSAPNYDSPLIRKALLDFIKAFGERYDGHPQIAFIEAGLLGIYGEWLRAGKDAPMASLETQKEILDAYEAAFRQTKILVRHPSQITLQRQFGYHDDWVGKLGQELDSCFRRLGITNSSAWQSAPIGGRIHPKLQECIWKEESCLPLPDDGFIDHLRNGHFSYLRFNRITEFLEAGPARERALNFMRAVGYEFYVSKADISANPNSLLVSVTITNTGAAPFYYQWPVEIALASKGEIIEMWETKWDIRTVQPHQTAAQFTFQATNISAPAGDYKVLMRLRPAASATGRPVAFANIEQDSVLPGFLTLGGVDLP